ncbi:hypothetical protein [Neisseria sp. S1]|uniref:hypothetical protein n=1 Tax=Neisseria sp. S1 TaxID=3318354 RepID=UPI003A855A81
MNSKELKKRIKALISQSPSSIEYLADVTRAPKEEVQMALDELSKAGEIYAKHLTVFKPVEKVSPREKQLEQIVRQRVCGKLAA